MNERDKKIADFIENAEKWSKTALGKTAWAAAGALAIVAILQIDFIYNTMVLLGVLAILAFMILGRR